MKNRKLLKWALLLFPEKKLVVYTDVKLMLIRRCKDIQRYAKLVVNIIGTRITTPIIFS